MTTVSEVEARLRAQGEDPRSLAFGATIRPTLAGYGSPSVAVRAERDVAHDDTAARAGAGAHDDTVASVPNGSPTPRAANADRHDASAESLEDSMAAPLPAITIDLREDRGASHPTSTADLEVRGTLGEGGMGRVLLARQRSLAREVAVKTTHPNASSTARDALIFEGIVTGRLEHPAIVPVHALGVDAEGRPAIVMKRIEGVAWSALVADPNHPAWEDWSVDPRSTDPDERLLGHLQILTLVCNALHFAHSRGFVHRDLKPDNVLIGRFGDVYVADWGIAARVGDASAHLCGTPGYLAPEMIDGRPVDARTDVYLLGAVLHELLTGTRRHRGSTLAQTILAASLSEPFDYDDSVPRELATLANHACARDPSARPPSAKAFREAIVAYVAHRESVSIGRRALESLEQLERVWRDAAYPDRERTIDRLVAEARFGLERALEGFPEFADAELGLARLEAILDERRARAAELEHLAREHDPSIGARSRALGLGLLALVGVVLVVLTLTVHRAPEPLTLFLYALAIFGVVAIVGVVMRRHLLANQIARRALATMLLATGFILASRGINLVFPSELSNVLSRDAFAASGVASVAAVTLFRWAGAAALSFLVTGVAVLAWPTRALDVFAFGAALASLSAAVLAWRSRPPEPPRAE